MSYQEYERQTEEDVRFSDLLIEQLRSTPWLLLSVVIHAVLAIVLNLMSVEPPHRNEVRPIQASADAHEDLLQPEPEEQEDPPQDLEPEEIRDDVVMADTDIKDPLETIESEPEFEDKGQDESETPFDPSLRPGVIGIGKGGLPGGGPFKGRRGGKGKGDPGGRGRLTVEEGLTWLKQHQSPDGRWDCDGFMANGNRTLGPLCNGRGAATHDVGTSGLALLAFLGAGQTHRDGPFKATVRKGLRWMKGQQDAEGCFGPRADTHYTYNHAIAALAMAEAYGMTKSGLWRNCAQDGINYAMKCQNPYKAWRYGERPGDDDISVTGWFVMALKSARLSKLDVNETNMRWAHHFAKEMTDEETGRCGYLKRGEIPVRAEGRLEQFPASESESLTAVGMLIRMFCDENPKESPAIKAGAELLSKCLPVWQPEAGRVDMYYWYYGTLAMFQLGGAEWQAWNAKMRSAIIESQRKDGNFKGSWDPVGPWGEDGGRVYATAVMTMCLEVYYRYPRVFGTR